LPFAPRPASWAKAAVEYSITSAEVSAREATFFMFDIVS
jgi:hypothetical protein